VIKDGVKSLLKISAGKVQKNPWSAAELVFGFKFAPDLEDSFFLLFE